MKTIEFAAAALLAAAVAAPAGAQTASADTRTPATVAVQTAIERVCLPVLGGQSMKTAAATANVKQNDSGWWLSAGGAQGVAILPPDSVNPHVCALTVTYQRGQGALLYGLLETWSADHGLKAVKTKVSRQGQAHGHVTSSWEGQTPKGAMALVLNVETGLNGAPASGGEGQAAVLVSLTPPTQKS